MRLSILRTRAPLAMVLLAIGLSAAALALPGSSHRGSGRLEQRLP